MECGVWGVCVCVCVCVWSVCVCVMCGVCVCTLYLQLSNESVFLQQLMVKVNFGRIILILFPINLSFHGLNKSVSFLDHGSQCGAFGTKLSQLILLLGELITHH